MGHVNILQLHSFGRMTMTRLTMKVTILHVTTLLLLLLSIANLTSAFGLVDYNDDCEFEVTDYSTFQSRYDQSKFCDTVRGLYCVPGLGKCGCIIPHTIYRQGKCRAKIGNSCLAPGNVRVDCVEHARCTNNNTNFVNTFKCQCIRGYLSNAMQTACFPVGWNDRRNAAFGSRYNSRNPYYWNGASDQFQPFTITAMISIIGLLFILQKCNLIS